LKKATFFGTNFSFKHPNGGTSSSEAAHVPFVVIEAPSMSTKDPLPLRSGPSAIHEIMTSPFAKQWAVCGDEHFKAKRFSGSITFNDNRILKDTNLISKGIGNKSLPVFL
jgi:hypothetical protein